MSFDYSKYLKQLQQSTQGENKFNWNTNQYESVPSMGANFINSISNVPFSLQSFFNRSNNNSTDNKDRVWSKFLNWGDPASKVTAGTEGNPIQFSAIDSTGKKQGGFNMPINPLGAGLAIGGGILNYLNRPEDIMFKGSMDNFQESNYTHDPMLQRSLRSIGNQANILDDYSREFIDQYKGMIDPNSAYNRSLQLNLAGQVGDQTNELANQQNAILAQRGVGGGGMAGLLGAAAQNRAGEQLRQGNLGLVQNSMNQAANFGNMALGATTSAGDLATGAAGIRNQMDARQLQNQQFNTQGQNQYQQYLDMGNWNQNVQNQNAQQAWMDNNISLLTGAFSMF